VLILLKETAVACCNTKNKNTPGMFSL